LPGILKIMTSILSFFVANQTNNTRMKKISTLLFICALVSSASTAQFSLKEDFLYPAQSLTTGPVSSMFWRSTSGTAGQMQVTSGGLTYTGYKVANALSNKVSLVSGNSEDVIGFVDINQDGVVDVNDTIPGPLIPNLYYSFLIKVNATTGLTVNSGAGDYFQAILPNNNTTVFSARLYIRQGSTSGFQLGLKMNSNASVPTVWAPGIGDNMTVGATYLLAFRYSFNPGTKDDAVEMWINPVLDGTIPAPLITSSNVDASTTLDLTKLGGILLRQATSTPTVDVDAIAAGVSWHDVVLPINVQSFQAALQNQQAQLNWTLSFDQNMKGFTVERSVDGSNFEAIGFVAASTNSGNQNYAFADAAIKMGINYYRLKITSKDGTFKYSSVVVIVNQQFGNTTLFPNPVKHNLAIAHDMIGRAGVARIFDISGKQVLQVSLQRGATQTSLTLPTLAAGTYMFVLDNGGQKTVSKFIKE
jgi:hypothetical protein